jgi:hypothetical protein
VYVSSNALVTQERRKGVFPSNVVFQNIVHERKPSLKNSNLIQSNRVEIPQAITPILATIAQESECEKAGVLHGRREKWHFGTMERRRLLKERRMGELAVIELHDSWPENDVTGSRDGNRQGP